MQLITLPIERGQMLADPGQEDKDPVALVERQFGAMKLPMSNEFFAPLDDPEIAVWE